MRVILINSPSLSARPVSRSMAGGLGFDGNDQMLLPPLDLAFLAGTLRRQGEDVELIDADPLRLDAAGILTRLQGHPCDVVIATVSLPTLEQDASFLAQLRQRLPQVRIFAKTLVRDQAVLQSLLELSGADLVIHGEADLTITDLVHGRSRSGTARLEPGPTDGSSVLKVDEGQPVDDLNQLPLPARDLLPNDRYRYPLLGTPVATLQTSRGCPYPCGYYCPYPLVEGVKWRAQSPERIFEELRDIVEQRGITKIYFRDATFTLNQERVARLCDKIVAAGWNLEWVCETRVDCLGDALLEKMRAAGCVGILIGVETGDERVMHQREGKKGLTVPKLSHLRKKASQLGIRLHFLLIVGLPQETRESIVDTYDLIQRYKPDTIGITVITPYPGTPLYVQGVREGWIDSYQWKDYGGHQVPMHTPNLSRDDMLMGKRLLEEGFHILQQRLRQDSPSLRVQGHQHYAHLLRWAYQLDKAVAQLHQASGSSPLTPSASSRLTPQVRPTGQHHPNADSTVHISVVIPTYNRRAILRKTLLGFSSQTLNPDHYEVIVVDDGSTDDTAAMIQRFKAPFALRLITQVHQGANAARNQGIDASRGEVLVLTGDDMIPEPGFLEAHAKFHEQHPAGHEAMLGFIDWSPEITVTPFMKFLVSPEGGQQFAFHEVKNGRADFRLFYTSNVSVKRSFLRTQSRLFDTDFTYTAFDDTELGYRLTQQGMQLHYNPLAVTCHHHAMTVEGFVQRQRRAGHMAVILAHKHPQLDRMMLGSETILRSPHRQHEQILHHLLESIAELEKIDRVKLARVRLDRGTLAQHYNSALLTPLYNAALTTAFHLGVIEASATPRGSEGVEIQHGRGHRFEVSIIIPVFNKVDLTRQCLTALAQVTQGVDYEVIVVDNHSTDGTVDFLTTLGGDVQVISNPDNLGFAKACNQGARAARGRHLLFLNNDTIPLPGWLPAMLQEFEASSDVAVVGSKLLYEDGTVQHAGVAFSRIWFTPYHIYGGMPADSACVNHRRELQCVTAACMLVRREAFEQAGGFDEGYCNGFEDVDFCLKIREQGRPVVYQPQSVLYHLESQTPGRKDHDRANAKRLLERWAHQWWLPDEDMIHFEDNYAMRAFDDRGILRYRLESLSDPANKSQWHVVASAQLASHRQDHSTVKALLEQPQDWPADVWVLRWAASLCRHVSAMTLAPAFWKRVLSLEEDPDARLALARDALRRSDLKEGRTHVTTLLAKDPHHGEAWLLRGITAMQEEAFTEAEHAFESALSHGADERKARLGRAMAIMGLKQADRAWDCLTTNLERFSDDAESLHWLLRAGAALERWEPLSEHLSRFITRNPADLSVRFALAGVFVRLGRLEAARREYDTLRLLGPTHEGLSDLAKALTQSDIHLASQHAS